MENFAFTPTPEAPALENYKTKQEIAENLSLILETCSKNNEEIHVAEDTVTASPAKLSGLYDKVEKKYKALLGAVVFAVSLQATVTATQEEKEAPVSSVAFEQSAEKNAIKETVGFDVEQEAEKVGRKVKFYSPNGQTKFTIIHVGQIHSTYADANYAGRNEIAKSQTEVGSFLARNISAQSDVFVEGYTDDTDEYTRGMREEASHINNAKNFEAIGKAYREACSRYYDKQSTAILNKITGDKLITAGFREVSPLVYSDGEQNFYLIESGYSPVDKDYTVSNETGTALAGAANILSIKGQINIKPAETIEGNSKGFELQARLREKGKLLEKFFVSTDSRDSEYNSTIHKSFYSISESSADAEYIRFSATSEFCKKSVECQKITKEIIEVDIPAIEKAVMEDREDIAVELIAKQTKTSTQNVFPLVYGSAHDFTRAILKWNKAHPDEQFNLVTVK